MLSELRDRNTRRVRRKAHIQRVVRGSALKPRLAVFRSNKHILAQLIDDEKGMTLFGIGTMSNQFKKAKFNRKSKEAAQELGKVLAQEAKKQKIEAAVFDRSHYKYHGVVAALADAAREAGLKF
jgi:large subunit ribosomal protein L18